MAINLRHVVLQVCIPRPVIPIWCCFRQPHYFHPWPCPVFLPNDTTEQSPRHALNLVCFVCNFQPACMGCLLLVTYNARTRRCHCEQGKPHNPALKGSVGHVQPSWPTLFPVSETTTIHPPRFLCVQVSPSFTAQFPALLPEARSQNWLLRPALARSRFFCGLPSSCAFFLALWTLEGFFFLSSFSIVSLKAGAVTYPSCPFHSKLA